MTESTNAALVVWSLANATLGAYVAFALFTRLNPYGVHDMRRASVLVLAALVMSLGSWACQLSSSRLRLIATGDPQVSLFVSFKPAFLALSICLPSLLIIGAFVILDLPSGPGLWNSGLCGLTVGLSVGFMHYALYLSIPTFDAMFSTTQILLSFFLCTSASLFSFLFITICRLKWMQRIWIRLLVPLVFGCTVLGSNFLSLNGTSFIPKGPDIFEQTEDSEKSRDILTLVVPAAISLVLAFLIVIPAFVNAITSDGRVLVNEKGMLPTRAVNLDGLPKDILKELDIRRNTFHWLLSLSFEWSILTPFVLRVMHNSYSPDVRLSLCRSMFLSCVPCKTPAAMPPPRSALKVRLIEAIVQLAEDLDISPTKIGLLYDRTLKSGTHIDIDEFLLLSEHASTELHDLERTLNATVADVGLMLFFVRDLSHRPAHIAVGHDDEADEADWIQRHMTRGYKLQFMRHLRYTLAQATSAAQSDVDATLLGCRDYVMSGRKPILESRATYVSLFSERWADDRSREVLVYDFAKHQIPSYRLDLQEFTSPMRDWLYDMAGISMSELILVCRDDVRQGRMWSTQSSSTSASQSDIDEYALLAFKDALAYALEQLMRNMSFIGPGLSNWTRLSSYVLDVPSVAADGPPAHMIILHAHVPELSDEPDSDFTHVSSCSVEMVQSQPTPMPSVFTYTPRCLFDVTQALVCSAPARAVFRTHATLEIEHLLAVGASAHAWRADCPASSGYPCERLPHALVSSFSIDTLSDSGSERPSRTRDAVARVSAGLTTLTQNVKTCARALSSLGLRTPRAHLSGRRTSNPISTTMSSSLITEPIAAFYRAARSWSVVEVNRIDANASRTVMPETHDRDGMHPFRCQPNTSTGRSRSLGRHRDLPPPPPLPLFVPANHPFGRCNAQSYPRINSNGTS